MENYNKAMQQYIDLGHCEVIASGVNDEAYYMQHHGLLKETSATNKLRVVFNASSKTTTGVSMNDLLMNVPPIQDKIFSLHLRFRFPKYVISADIVKIYFQVLIRPEDRKYQRCLYFLNGKVKELQFKTLVVGQVHAQYVAIRCIQQLTLG